MQYIPKTELIDAYMLSRCSQCQAITTQKPLYIKLQRPEQHWETIFTLCKSCSELKRDALSHISRETYVIFDLRQGGTGKIKQLIGAVMARYASAGHSVPLTLERISVKLRPSTANPTGVRISESDLKCELSEMVKDKLIGVQKIDYTAKLIQELLRREKYAPCPSCSHRTLVSLYFQISGVSREGEKSNVLKKMGQYCVNCGRTEMNTEAVWPKPKDVKDFTAVRNFTDPTRLEGDQ